MRRDDLPFRAVFGLPILLGAASLIGLVGALIGDGLWDLIGAGLLATVIVVVVVVWARARR